MPFPPTRSILRTPMLGAALLAPTFLVACDGSSPTPAEQTVDALVFRTEPTTTAAGAAIDPAVQVELVDAGGARVTGAEQAVTITIGTNPAAGTLAGTGTVTAIAGVASFSGLWIDRAGTGYTLQASTSGVPSATSASFDITAGPATELRFATQPSDTLRGEVMAPPVEVGAWDEFGNPAVGFTGTVDLTLDANPGQGSLLGTTSVAAVAGVATFSDLALDSAGAGYRLRATSGALTDAVSSPFDITLAREDQDLDGDGFSPSQGDCDDEDAAIAPDATDLPDGAYIDSNCDGLDGDAGVATFVATTGQDVAGCGSLAAPCATVQAGLAEAQSAGDRDVYVMAGTYADGAVFLADGINVFGGYGTGWARDGTDTTRIMGATGVAVVTGASEAATLVADGLTQATIVADLTIIGPDAVGTHPDGGGKSSYAFWVKDVAAGLLTIEGNTLVAGDGAAGAPGAAGQNASVLTATSSMNGAPGQSAAEFSTTCNDSDRGSGGSRGTNAIGGRDPDGGVGGHGGTMDSDCSSVFSPDLSATPGLSGGNALYTAAPAGLGGSGGATCQAGQHGAAGAITNGPGGSGGTGGRLSSDFWIGQNGLSGGVGANGGGGGGGGGSGGCDTGTDEYGAGGGGGGAGGMRAVSGGGGGAGGGGSFGLYLVNASPTVRDNTFLRGAGGDGGNGGTGGQGQSGGAGGLGGSAAGDTGPGGNGGDGGHGGHGGGGGGGEGGISAGVFALSSTPVLEGNGFSGGSGGAAGTGGPSAPGAPTPERDGNDGAGGAPGSVATVVNWP